MLSLPPSLLSLLAAFLLTPTLTLARPPLELGVPFAELFNRQACSQEACGWTGQLCCPFGACYTDLSNNQASCSSTLLGAVAQSTQAAGGYWQYYTTTYTQTDLATVTQVMSTYVGGAPATVAAAAPTGMACSYALGQQTCGQTCCASDQYCFDAGSSQCSAAAAAGSSGYYTSYYSTMYASTNSAGVPLRPTSSTLIIVTETSAPTTTVPFLAPIATGANMTLTTAEASSSGLSGGAIAGIVIGVLLGLALLALLIFYCCLRGLWVTIFGRKRKERRTEVDVYERHSHHGSGAAAGRTWYGASKPSRVERRDEHKGRNGLAFAGALAGLWAILGLKRRSKKRDNEKYSEYSYSSDYYTSASE
ncbi:hypothetical protein B0A48_02851 [Cryoendolithus antarcticus]|uniref:Mid2 domain-containing protein n=1 Tax=Cryoendolithus antarcticus TaxID=1507870 RepID=A0A1V8TLG1_9PEZI|nr:hypothetical protein B0A48_02851 [Cryoendolithus antarcticus]